MWWSCPYLSVRRRARGYEVKRTGGLRPAEGAADSGHNFEGLRLSLMSTILLLLFSMVTFASALMSRASDPPYHHIV